MTNSHKNIINPFLESSTLLIMTFPEIVESKDLLWGRTCAVDNVRARRKGVLGKLYEIQISPERGLRNSLKFPSYFGMEYVRPWNMGKKLLESSFPSGFIWSLGHVSNAATISPGVLAILSAGAGNIWLIVAPSLIMQMDVDRIINVGWSAKGLKIGWQK